MQEPQWIEWSGGDCPVSANTLIEAKGKTGDITKDTASGFDWQWDGASYDIAAYRVLPPTKFDIQAALATLTAAGYTMTPREPAKRMVRITIDVPEPMTEAPEVGADYWRVVVGNKAPNALDWDGYDWELRWLKAGICYDNEADAQAALDAWAKRTVVPLGDV